MAKAILLIRVSSAGQSYEQQTKDLKEFAVKDGYDENDLIIIETKESARKLSEEERLGLNEMKEAIQKDPSIDCVYCREINRIGRRYDVLTSMKWGFSASLSSHTSNPPPIVAIHNLPRWSSTME